MIPLIAGIAAAITATNTNRTLMALGHNGHHRLGAEHSGGSAGGYIACAGDQTGGGATFSPGPGGNGCPGIFGEAIPVEDAK